MPGKSKKGGGLEVGSPYKMKGFSGFGNSPLKQEKKSKKASERPLTLEERQASMDTIRAARYRDKEGGTRDMTYSSPDDPQLRTDREAYHKLEYYPQREHYRTSLDPKKATKRSEERLVKGKTKMGKKKKIKGK